MSKENEKAVSFSINNNYLYYENEKGDQRKIGRAMKISKLISFTDSGEWCATLAYFDQLMQKREMLFYPHQLSMYELIKLRNKGVDAKRINAEKLLEYLEWCLDNDEIIEHVKAHKELGWVYKKGKRLPQYRTYKIIGGNEESTYMGKFDLKPTGALKDTIQFYKDELSDNPILQLILSISLSSILLPIINDNFPIDSMVISLCGASSSGKTTSLCLALSPFSSIESTNLGQSVIGNWNGTSNAIMKNIVENKFNGFAFGMDELGASSIKDFTSFIYSFTGGLDKLRLTSESEINDKDKPQIPFKTYLLSTSEKMLNQAIKSDAQGAKVIRLHEFADLTYTKSAEQSERIKNFTKKNYGVIAPKFVERVLEKGDAWIIETWKEYKQDLEEMIRPYVFDKLAPRISSNFSVWMVGFTILDDIVGSDWSIDDVANVLVDSTKDKVEDVNLTETVYNLLVETIVTNENHFLEYKGRGYSRCISSSNITTTLWGKFNDDEYVISRTCYEKILRNNNYQNPKLILKKFLDEGILIPETCKESTRVYNRRTLNSQDKIQVVVLKRNAFSDENETEIE